jgi:hypothetical protein
MQPPFPDKVRTANQMIGYGDGRRQKLKVGWRKPFQLTIGGSLSCETAAFFGTRNLGGLVTPTEVAIGAGAFDVKTIMQTQAQKRVPKFGSIGFTGLGGYDWIWPHAVSNFEISWEGENDVQYSAALVGSGYCVRMQDLDPPLIVPATIADEHTMHPAVVKVTFTGDLGTRDFAADGDLISGACGLNNQVVVKQRNGDPPFDPTAPNPRKTGFYARDVHIGTRIPMARLKVAVDDDLQVAVEAENEALITNLRYLFRSDDLIRVGGGGAETIYYYEYEWNCPVAQIESIDPDPDGDDGALTMQFYPETDNVSGGYWVQRIRTHQATIT